MQALQIHGVIKGTILSVWRILRCNPWSEGGVDRVPVRGKWPTKPLDHDELLALYEQEDHAKGFSKANSATAEKTRK